MADTCVASHINYCGTDAHGWLSGSHPVVAEGAVRRKVCYPNFGACCPFSNYISVRNCGLFFVYKLQPPAHCFLRYCGNGFPQAPGNNVCMYVCMYVCMCVYVCMNVCVYVCMYVCMYE